MHPAFSVILFTTASGAGYGLLALLGLLAPLGLLPADRWFGLAGLGLALGAIGLGLVSSTFHLGHPERAWRAFSQWRSSWLSREGVAAVASFLPAGLFALGWVVWEWTSGPWAVAGVLSAIMAAVTVYCTAMIYASLKTVQRWHNGWVPSVYGVLALMTGALWLNALTPAFGSEAPAAAWIALLSIPLAAAVKLGYWRFIDGSRSGSTPESATGLGALGKVSLLEAPHTSENYLLREMGFQIARKHAAKLRRIALLLGFALPLLLTLPSLFEIGDGLRLVAGLAAAVSATAGVLVERWLFFAEAKHAVTLYYGAAVA